MLKLHSNRVVKKMHFHNTWSVTDCDKISKIQEFVASLAGWLTAANISLSISFILGLTAVEPFFTASCAYST